MDNFLIIDDVDTCYIEQNSWIILLEKQIVRNYHLLKLYEMDKSGKKCKVNCKDLNTKIKCSINNSIKAKIKNRKQSQKITYLNENQSASFNLRRKTEEIPKKTLTKMLERNDSNSPTATATRYLTAQQALQNRQTRYACKQSINYNILPLESLSMGVDKSQILLQSSSKKEQKRTKFPKYLSQTKPILSLHQLEFNTREIVPSEQSHFQKRLTHIEKLLIRSSMNSPKKQMHTSKHYGGKRTVEELPEIGKLDCKKIYMSEFVTQHHYHFETEPMDSKENSPNSLKKTQQTKQSDSQNFCGLESILQYYMKSRNKQKQQGFEDCHINKSSLIKNYRISKIRNIKYPVN